ncbi:hypothetical protein B0H17DRAFT_1334447 [Mycena rosella]|uniref:E3 ubiquitin-protein ligase listerin n=1 Tax=Mycena rosella TaxID=1033263 RepID=A0AAD7GCK4_MYCRO|nr:hypothetical protein B0H17DRAFT_1334447 [Mycena rosella]
MAPKSSASSGTRKKHARKAAGPVEPEAPREKKGKKAHRSDPPRQKVYVAPVKPSAAQADPLETTGLAHRLPPALLVVLRSLAKKAPVTKVRALEELLSGWVERCAGDEDDTVLYAVLDMLPVWTHHLPAHLLHPDRRIRLLTATVHAALLRVPLLRPALADDAPPTAAGAWALAAHDVDRAVATVASAARVPSADPAPITHFVARTLMRPDALYAELNPPPPAAPSLPAAKRPTGVVDPAPAPARTKADEFDESEPDRRARLRIAAFGALKHLLETDTTTPLPAFLASPALWSALHHAPDPPFLHDPLPQDEEGHEDEDDHRDAYTEGFGTAQPALRRAAWAALPAVLAHRPLPPALVRVLARAVLRSAWVEPDPGVQGAMWAGVLGFLKDHPHAWTHAPEAYAEFRTAFLARACGGAPVAAYPTVVVVVSTVPNEILHPVDTLFDAFWAALGGAPRVEGFAEDSRPAEPVVDAALESTHAGVESDEKAESQERAGKQEEEKEGEEEEDEAEVKQRAAPALTTALPPARARAGAAFVRAVLECAVFVARRGGVFRARGQGEDDDEEDGKEGTRLFAREVARVWGALAGSGDQLGTDDKQAKEGKERGKEEGKRLLHVEVRRAAGLLRGALGAAGGDLLPPALAALSDCVRRTAAAGGNAELVCAVLEALVGDDDDDESGDAAATLEGAAASGEAEVDAAATKTPDTAQAIRAAGRALSADVLRAAVDREDAPLLVRALAAFGPRVFRDGVGEALDALLARRAYALLLTAPPLLLAYLTHRAPRREALFRALLRDVAAHPEAAADALAALVAPEAARALEGLRAVDGDDEAAAGPLDALFAGAGAGPERAPLPVRVRAQVLQRAERFLSRGAARAALGGAVSAFATRVEAATAAGAELGVGAFDDDVVLLGGVLDAEAVDAAVLMPAVYVLAHVLPRAVPYAAGGAAREMWGRWREGGAPQGAEVRKEVLRRLGAMVRETAVCVTPEDVLAALAEDTLGAPLDVVAEVFPPQAALDAMLDALPGGPPAPSLAVLRPHLPPVPAPAVPAVAHDARGYTAYARTVAALLDALAGDRRAARTHVWALRHVLALALVAEDLLAVPAAPSAVFDGAGVDRAALGELAGRARGFATFLLTAAAPAAEEGWRARVLAAVTGGAPLVGGGALPGLLVELIGCARRTDASRDCRILDRVLRHLLQDADKAEADLWMAFARKIEKTAPETCITVVSAVSDSTLEPPRLERYRNELAADLLGVPASKANTQGLLTLRKLAASAPDVESDVVFLPQQRSVNIFKACQQWVSSDEDIEEELESAMTLVFFHLAPLLQNVPGTHWDLVFDVLENNLENAALTDDDTLVVLARTLRLIILIQDLTLTNKTLRASWEERQMQILTMVRDLAAGQLDDVAASTPRSTCRELVLSIVQDLPASLITQDTLPKMCHLLTDPSVDVQKMTYQLLTVAARKRTEHFVIEAGVDVDAAVKADLPLELLDILQTSLNFNQGDLLELDESTVFGYLLGWMVVFDLFTDASLKVRLSYIDQLRTLDIIGTSFIPNLLSLLGVDQGIPKAFKLDPWAVDEYFVQLYESGSAWSFQVLAAHLYYRALLTVPSLIYNWVLDCKDRQLSSSIATYTSLHFSPVIIRAELAHVKSPETTAELVDENLTIKVATAVNEVVASYLVDEHQLEIKLKIPSDWPLHKIEVKDVQRVGVDESRWRAWILAVQQTLWSQNGRIVDGIGLFKKNVTGHFEGQVECAICYSIISVMDGSLPRKPCKTCKNRFHSGCLYKWFSSSHSSSCPLCRSDIF